jgi:small-conductance mechanosensitive channel
MALLAVCGVFAWTTRDAMANLPFMRQKASASAAGSGGKALVDLGPWQTAQALAALAVTAEETEYAREAEHLADHEVDQAFASALREANLKAAHRSLTGDALALSEKVKQLEQTVAQDQGQVDKLTPPASSASVQAKGGDQAAANSGDLEIAKAQLQLDSDELSDAEHDLERASGDNRDEIQSELSAHEAAMQKYDSQNSSSGELAVISVRRRGTLASRLSGWFSQQSRYQLIQQAIQQAQSDVKSLTAEHNTLETQANAHAAAGTNAADNPSTLASLKARSAERQLLGIYDDRIQTERQLATVYSKWAAQLQLQHRIVEHLIFQSFALILFILICMVAGDSLVRHLMALNMHNQRQKHTLRSILELSIQVVGWLLILLVVFGLPQQMPTILGLATAGITIVLQDFILAFFGWFVLMGKNGIRVGDRVEINGVCGEAAEIGLMNTTLLETGKLLTDGLPTGRRIVFMNSFAIRGQYFNFSTTGQWMWDEIKASLPASANPRDIVERVRKLAIEETGEGAALAAREWQKAAYSHDLSRIDTEPVVSLLTTASGFDVQVRYVTSATKRFEVRTALQRRVLDLLQEQK